MQRNFVSVLLLLLCLYPFALPAKAYDGKKTPRENMSLAISNGDLKKVRSLIESLHVGFDDPTNEFDYKSPLLEAAEQAQLPIMEYLVEKGAYIEGISENGSTPLTTFIKHGGSKLPFEKLLKGVQFLLKKGANINDGRKNGYTPLMAACEHTRCIELVELFLNLGALIDARDHEESTPLLVSLRSSNIAAARSLLQHGASIYITYKGLTPLCVLAWEGNLFMAKFLLEEVKVLVNEYSEIGVAPISCAAAGGNGSMIKLLVEHGADINTPTIAETHLQIPKRGKNNGKTYITFPKGTAPMDIAKALGFRGANVISHLGGVVKLTAAPKEWVDN